MTSLFEDRKCSCYDNTEACIKYAVEMATSLLLFSPFFFSINWALSFAWHWHRWNYCFVTAQPTRGIERNGERNRKKFSDFFYCFYTQQTWLLCISAIAFEPVPNYLYSYCFFFFTCLTIFGEEPTKRAHYGLSSSENECSYPRHAFRFKCVFYMKFFHFVWVFFLFRFSPF